MRRYLKIVFLSIVSAAGLFAGLAFLALRHSLPPMPKLAGKIERGALEHGGRRRTWIAYLPPKPAAHPALLIALHSSMGTGEQARAGFGYDFVTQFPDRDPGDGSTAERSLWSAPGKRSVALYTIEGGGHGVPHPATYGRRLLGNSNRDIHAANEIWEFFQSAP